MADIRNWPVSRQRETPEDVCVSFWHIPGGHDYSNAMPVEVYFADREYAERFCEQYSNAPEMAVII